MNYIVSFSKLSLKQIDKAPKHIREVIKTWADTVEHFGLPYARLFKGYHDEPLKGQRKKQRSVRLNKQWRLIYSENESTQEIEIYILEVTPHDYRIR
jgi:proteic killer suppression protein